MTTQYAHAASTSAYLVTKIKTTKNNCEGLIQVFTKITRYKVHLTTLLAMVQIGYTASLSGLISLIGLGIRPWSVNH